MLLVTGATGFLGRNLCTHLAEQGYRVRALVRSTSDVTFLRELGVELAVGDLRDPKSVLVATQNCHKVVHAGGRFRFWGRRDGFFTTNVQGTANVLEAALQVGVERIIYISTIAVIGAPHRKQVLDEQVPCDPRDDYQRSKLEAEKLVLLAHKERGLPAIVLRPGAFYGPWGRYAFNRMFFEDPLKGLPMGVHLGKRITFPVYVIDVARTIEAALTRGQPGEIYNVVGPVLSHAEVHATISRAAGIRSRRINPPAVIMIWIARMWTYLSRFTRREPYYSINMSPYVFCDWNAVSEKAERDLGFSATSFDEGARVTVSWYREQGIGPTNWLGRLMLYLWQSPSARRGDSGDASNGCEP